MKAIHLSPNFKIWAFQKLPSSSTLHRLGERIKIHGFHSGSILRICPNVKMIPPGSLDYRHPSDFVMHFPGKGQGLALPAGNTGMLCLEHSCSVTQDLVAKPSTWESSGTTSPQAHPVGRTRISLPHTRTQLRCCWQPGTALWGGDFGAPGQGCPSACSYRPQRLSRDVVKGW